MTDHQVLLLHPDFASSQADRINCLNYAHNVFASAKRSLEDRHDTSLPTPTPSRGCHDKDGSDSCSSQQIIRSLSNKEIDALEQNGCTSSDWTKLRVMTNTQEDGANDKTPIRLLSSLVSNTRFDGSVVLILSSLSPEVEPPADGIPVGLHGCLLVKNCILSISTVRIYQCSSISNTFVDHGATILNCGTFQTDESYPSSMIIAIGAESGGGRRMNVTPEATLLDLSQQLLNNQDPSVPFTEFHTFRLNVVSRNCDIRNTSHVESVFLHENVKIHGASSVTKSVLLPNSMINHSSVHCSFLQWHANVSGQSSVSDCLVMEQTSIGPLSIVQKSILSPDVHVSAGEIHASFIGPNCNAHHQSLLIGVIWPLGRGNVGYGANVGSNHTGRLPDQECTVGEGIFWGLSCVIKLPVDLSMAPYSIVAAGVHLGHMRCTMPFSLLVTDTTNNGVSILPGWVWKNSPYTIARSEVKFATRRKAKRHESATGWKIIRPEIVELCRMARESLQRIGKPTELAVHIGNCTLTDTARLSGIESYTSLIHMFALQGLLANLMKNEMLLVSAKNVYMDRLSNDFIGVDSIIRKPSLDPSIVHWPAFPWETDQSDESTWLYQKSLLLKEFPKYENTSWEDWIIAALHQLLQLEVAHSDRIYKCKRRDDERGSSIVPGYEDSHISADNDPVVQAARAELRQMKEHVKRIVALCSSSKSNL